MIGRSLADASACTAPVTAAGNDSAARPVRPGRADCHQGNVGEHPVVLAHGPPRGGNSKVCCKDHSNEERRGSDRLSRDGQAHDVIN